MRYLEKHPILPAVRGNFTDSVEQQIPDGFLWKSQNVLNRFGEIRTRPGFIRVAPASVPVGGRVTGGYFFKNISDLGRVVAGTLTALNYLQGTTWTDISGTPLTGNADNPNRFTVFPSSGSNWLLQTNNVDAPRMWDGVAPTFVPIPGFPPIARDLFICFNRVVACNVVESGIRASSRLRISAFNDHQTWPPNLVLDLTDTDDQIIGGRNLNRSTGLIYKDNSIWIIQGQAGTFPFQLDVLEKARPGPLSTAMIVEANGAHYYLGYDFGIYRVDQLGARRIGGVSDSQLQLLVRMTSRQRAFGFYRRLDRAVWFVFPSNQSSDPDNAISIDVETEAIHFHKFAFSLGAAWQGDDVAGVSWGDLLALGLTWQTLPSVYPTWLSMGGTLFPTEFIGAISGQVYRFVYDKDDDGSVIDQSWEYPPKAHAGTHRIMTFDSVESSFEQRTGGPLVSVDVGVSETLGEALQDGPSYTEIGKHDTAQKTRQLLSLRDGIPLEGRFMNERYRCRSSIPIKFKGGLLYAQAEDLA